MELQLGLGLPSEKTMKGLDLNSYVSEPKGLQLGSGQLQLGQYSWFSTNVNDKKRSFIDAFEESSENEDGPQTLPLLVWNNQPNDEDDFPKDLDNHSSNSCASNNDGESDGIVGWPPIKFKRKKLSRQSSGALEINRAVDSGCEDCQARTSKYITSLNLQLPKSIINMKFTSSIVALGSIASVAAQSCAADNCLRALRAPARLEEARAFCGTFTATASGAIPTYASAACTGNVASRVSSACSCIATTASSTTSVSSSVTSSSSPVTTSASSTSAFTPHVPIGTSYCDDATYPALPLPTGAFDPEGYAVVNPIGAVSGGAGGPTSTFKASDGAAATRALAAAATSTGALTIVIDGVFDFPTRFRIGSNKSVWGSRAGGTIGTNGITVNAQTNVIIRNLKVTGVLDNDCITIQNTTRVWIDHNDLSSSPNIIKNGPDLYDGLLDVIRGSDWITVSWNYFHDHYKASLVGNNDQFRDIDGGRLHLTYHHNYFRNLGTRGNAGRFGHQHLYNNYYKDFRYQAIHSRSDNQVLVEGNVFTGDTREALSTYGLVIPEDSPNTSPLGDYELDGFANLGALNDFGGSGVNITQVGNYTSVPYTYRLDPLSDVPALVVRNSGLGKVFPQ